MSKKRIKSTMLNDADKFYILFEAYLKVCKKYMSRLPASPHLFLKTMDQCRVSIKGDFSFSDARVMDVITAASAVFMGNRNTSEYRELTNFVATHKIIGRRIGGRAYAEFGGASFSESALIGNLLMEYLRRNKSFSKNKRIILSLYRKMLKFYSQSCIKASIKCYLENVGIESKILRINENIQIRSLTLQDIAILYNTNKCFKNYYSGVWIKNNNLKYIKAVIYVCFTSRITFEGEKSVDQPFDPYHRGQIIINDVLTALRLHTIGDVNSSPITLQIFELPFHNEERPWGDNLFRYPKFQDDFSPQIYRQIKRTFQGVTWFRKSQSDPDLLLNRLSVTTHRNREEDIIVDSCIAFEILVKSYLAKKGDEKISSRDLAIYIAHLIGKNSAHRKIIFDIIREGFSLRNNIVHGKRINPRPHDLLIKFASVLRHAIRAVITQGTNITPKKITELIL